MAITINGTTGVAGVDGSASTPAVQGSDTNTGVTFGADTVNIVTGGTTRTTVDSSGNVGIGTSSPSAARLHVVGVSGGYVQKLNNVNSTRTWAFGVDKVSTNDGIFVIDDVTAGANRLAIDTSGNVLIGSPTYTKRLSVKDTTNTVVVIEGSNSGSSNINFADSDSENPGSINYSHATNYMAFQTAGAERARIDSSGNVGIGLSTVNDKLSIVDGNYLSFQTASQTFNSGRVARIGGISVGSGNGYMTFETYQGGSGGGERMRIDSSGNVGIGAASGGNRLYVIKSDNTYYLTDFANSFTSGNGYINRMQFSGSAPNNTSSIFTAMVDTGGSRCIIYANGGIANYQANDSNLSDRREKTNFAPAKSYLDTICAIPVQTFNYIDQNLDDDPGLTLGVVAQDVQAVAPELVMESNWGTQEEPKMRLSVYQTDLQYALMKCIQELKADNDDLRARIAALEGAK